MSWSLGLSGYLVEPWTVFRFMSGMKTRDRLGGSDGTTKESKRESLKESGTDMWRQFLVEVLFIGGGS